MAKKEFLFHGKTKDEVKNMSLKEFAQLIPSRQRRSLVRGLTEEQKIFLKDTIAGKKNLKTHCRDLVITPHLLDKTVMIHNGKEFVTVEITLEKLGHVLGEFAMSRKRVGHSSSSAGGSISVK
jgi:small subunit ribosomal protein S19